MKALRPWWPGLAFLLTAILHAAWFSRGRLVCVFDAKGVCIGDRLVSGGGVSAEGFAAYLKQQDYWLGFAIALAVGFAVYALTRRKLLAGGAGLSVGAMLAVVGCFVVGCCGSPMLAVWLSLLGAKALGLAKPLVAMVTAISVVVGGLCLRRGCQTDCCRPKDGETHGR